MTNNRPSKVVGGNNLLPEPRQCLVSRKLPQTIEVCGSCSLWALIENSRRVVTEFRQSLDVEGLTGM